MTIRCGEQDLDLVETRERGRPGRPERARRPRSQEVRLVLKAWNGKASCESEAS